MQIMKLFSKFLNARLPFSYREILRRRTTMDSRNAKRISRCVKTHPVPMGDHRPAACAQGIDLVDQAREGLASHLDRHLALEVLAVRARHDLLDRVQYRLQPRRDPVDLARHVDSPRPAE